MRASQPRPGIRAPDQLPVKSSSWGPQKGFIPVEQRFSKLHFAKKDRAKEIEKYDGEVKKCLQAGRARQVPLSLSVGGIHCEVLVVEASDGQLEDEVRLALSHEGKSDIEFHHVRHMGGILPEEHEVVEKVRDVMGVHQ